MPRNSSGTYSLPAGNPVVSNTLIQTSWANPTMSDLGSALTDSLDRNGRGAMLAPLKGIDGTAVAPSLTFSSEGTLGIYRVGAGILGIAAGGALVLSIAASGLVFAQPIVLPIGSAGAPSMTFTGNTNTGIYSPATNQVAITNAGVQRLTVDASGIVTMSAGALVLSSTTNTITAISGTGTLAFQTGGATTRLAIDAAGAVTVSGATSFSSTVAHAGVVTMNNNVALDWKDNGGTARRIVNLLTTPDIYVGDMDNAIASSVLHLSANGSAEFDINGSKIGAVNSGGLSLTASGAKFSVISTSQEQLRLANDAAYISWYNSANTTRSGFLQISAGGALTLSQDQAQSVQIATNAITRLTIDANGFVGIGRPPISTVMVAMSDGTITTLVGFNYSANTISGIGTNTAHALGFLTSGAERMRIDTSGNVGIGKTASAGFLLDVAGVLRLTPAQVGGVQVGLNLTDAGTGSGEGIAVQWESGSRTDMARIWAVGASAGADMVFATNAANTGSASERARIDASGNFGIGKAPAVRLDVTTSANAIASFDSTGGGSAWVQLSNSGAVFGYLGNGTISSGTTSDVALRSQGALYLTSGGSTARLTITSAGVVQDATAELGWKDIPQNAQTSAYTLVLADRGKSVTITTGGVTVPNAIFSAGNVVTVTNNSATAQTITQGSSFTLHQGGSTNTGNRTLLAWGIATIEFLSSSVGIITGNIT